jgi:hypothetical protein
MAPSSNLKFSNLFAFPWPGDATNNSDFADNQQSDISTDEESILLGDNQVVAEGCAADSNDNDLAGDKEVADDGAANNEAAIDEEKDSSSEERCAHSLYMTMTAKLPPTQGWISHSQMSKLASC